MDFAKCPLVFALALQDLSFKQETQAQGHHHSLSLELIINISLQLTKFSYDETSTQSAVSKSQCGTLGTFNCERTASF